VAARPPAFAIWITGLPASGKSTVAAALASELGGLGVEPAILESDVLRPIFMPHDGYDEASRDVFYRQIAYVGALLVRHGVPVIFDATANRRRYRDRARQEIPRFLEVYVDCPLSICMDRDPKGIYRRAKEGGVAHVPGLQDVYEAPESSDIVIHGAKDSPAEATRSIVAKLREKGLLAS
jgi:adenylylsulfate kinase